MSDPTDGALTLEQIQSVLNVDLARLGDLENEMISELNRRRRTAKSNTGGWTPYRVNEIATWATVAFSRSHRHDSSVNSHYHAYKSILLRLREREGHSMTERYGSASNLSGHNEDLSSNRSLKRRRSSSSLSESVIHHDGLQTRRTRARRYAPLGKFPQSTISDDSNEETPDRVEQEDAGEGGEDLVFELNTSPTVLSGSIIESQVCQLNGIPLALNMPVLSSAVPISNKALPRQLQHKPSNVVHPLESPTRLAKPTQSGHEWPLRDFKILILDEDGCYKAYMTLADIVPTEVRLYPDVVDYAELQRLHAVVQGQISGAQDMKLVFRGDYVVAIRDDVLLRFALKDAYHSDQGALRLIME